MAKLVSKTYGEALFEVAVEEGTIDSTLEEVQIVLDVIEANEQYIKLTLIAVASNTGTSIFLLAKVLTPCTIYLTDLTVAIPARNGAGKNILFTKCTTV